MGLYASKEAVEPRVLRSNSRVLRLLLGDAALAPSCPLVARACPSSRSCSRRCPRLVPSPPCSLTRRPSTHLPQAAEAAEALSDTLKGGIDEARTTAAANRNRTDWIRQLSP